MAVCRLKTIAIELLFWKTLISLLSDFQIFQVCKKISFTGLCLEFGVEKALGYPLCFVDMEMSQIFFQKSFSDSCFRFIFAFLHCALFYNF